eukprot:m.359567 g.359567  ORF g.359567 m.359567 type:complete len:150 (+) comp20760_c0_seq3:378-827(+)
MCHVLAHRSTSATCHCRYSDAIAILEQDFLFVPEIKQHCRAIKMACSLNIAMCQLKLEKYADVIGICTVMIEQDPECVKAHFRMGRAHEALGEFVQAIKAYEKALQYEPTLVAATKAISVCRSQRKKQELQDRQKFQGLFGSTPSKKQD